jgi:hypothetical protein
LRVKDEGWRCKMEEGGGGSLLMKIQVLVGYRWRILVPGAGVGTGTGSRWRILMQGVDAGAGGDASTGTIHGHGGGGGSSCGSR